MTVPRALQPATVDPPGARTRHLIVCGLLEEDSRLLFELLRDASAGGQAAFHDGPALDTAQRSAERWVSHCAADLLTIGRIRKTLSELRDLHFVVAVRDPRELLVKPSTWWPVQPAYGFDHSFHKDANGVVTLTEPGLQYLNDVIRKACRHGFATVVRREDLLADAAAVQRHLEPLVAGPLMPPAAPADATHRIQPDAVPWTEGAAASRVVRQFRLAPELFDMLQRLGYAKDRGWHEALAATAPQGLDEQPGTVVGYYTVGTRYEQEAARLWASVQAHELPVELVAVPPRGDWLSSVRHKPSLLLELRRRLRGPLLYVDVDAVVHSNPWPYLRGMDCDIAVASQRARSVISGTILINDTPGAEHLLQAWVADLALHPVAWDQHSLHNVVYAVGGQGMAGTPRIHHLPPELCRVFDRKYHVRIGNIIEHLQASREMRVEDGTERSRDALARRRARVREIESELPQQPPLPGSYASLPADVRHERTVTLMSQGRSDLARWSVTENLKQAWSSRAEVVAALVGAGGSVLDLGCGRMDLEKALPPGVRYLPSDIVTRDDRTLVADLNQGQLPAVEADVVTLLGVLEYLYNPPAALAAIATRWPRLILTYNPADLDRGRSRRHQGWVNDLRSAELVQIALAAGFRLEVIVPFEARQRIYEFTREASQ